MVGNDDIESVITCPLQWFEAPDPAIYADHQRKSVFLRLFKCRNVYPVTLRKTVGYVKSGFRSHHAQHLTKQERAGGPVYIIIAPDQDLLPVFDRLLDTV